MTFTAAQLEEAIESNPHFEGWDEVGYGQEPDPNYDPAKAAEFEVLRSAYYSVPYNRRDDSAYKAYTDFYTKHRAVLSETRSCAPKVTVNGVEYDIEVVHDHGGGEGSGEERWVVIKVDGRLFRKDGFYASYVGSSWDGELREVQAVEKPVTFYEPLVDGDYYDSFGG